MTFRGVSGAEGEDFAADYLIKNGYRILERNYQTSLGEIDIIARDGETLVFIEVKARSSTRFGPPQLAVDHRKQVKITRVALAYLSQKKNRPVSAGLMSLPFGKIEEFLPSS